MEKKYIKLTEQDYEELIQWIIALDGRVNDLERTLGILEEAPHRSTLSKTRIYEEKVGGLEEE